MTSSTIVTRFAPSPTGYLHVGGARTALFNWLLARHCGGRFLLRIEDTDLARSTEQATTQLLDDLKWLGLNWDNAELVYQSRRLTLYNRLIEELLGKGLAYEAWETSEELDAMRQQAMRAKRAFIYRKPTYTDDQRKRFEDEGRKSVIRFAMPVKEFRFHDVVLGKDIVQSHHESQDFVIRKTDGMPTYHFGVVVDDAEMQISHVLRGLEHLKNTFNHIALQEALGFERPIYAHLSVILNPETGEKLSKRDRDRKIRRRVQEWLRSAKKSTEDIAAASGLNATRLTDWIATDTHQLDLDEQPKVMAVVGLRESELPEIMINDFRKNGYLPEVLNNFLSLLGWSAGGDREQLSMQEMVELFSIDRINSSNAKFNREKLKAFSTDAASKASPQRLIAALRDYLTLNSISPLNRATDVQLEKILAMNAGFHILSEVDLKSRFLLQPDSELNYERDAIDKVLLKNERQGADALRDIRPMLEELSDWSHGTLERAVKSYCEQKQLGLGKVAQPLRVAVSGSAVSPPIFECLEFLGKPSVLARIDRCLLHAGTT